MEKWIKMLLITVMLAGIMFIFSGCAYYNTIFSVECDGGYMADKYVDLLIPIDENDEYYTEYNNLDENIKFSNDMPHIPEESEIVAYDRDGYRSMLMHLECSHLTKDIRDSEGFCYDNKNYNGVPAKVCYNIFLPNEWIRKSNDPYGDDVFVEFCGKYEYYRLAVFDGEGNIIQISERMPMKLLGSYTNCDIEYDPENNTIRQGYIMSKEQLLFWRVLVLIAMFFALISLILLIVFNVRARRTNRRNCKIYVVISAFMNIPMLINIFWRLLMAVAFSESVKAAVFGFLCSYSAIGLIPYIITTAVFIFFCVIDHKLKDPDYIY